MESRADSRISGKRYETNLNEVYSEDVNVKSELYKVNIFGHTLHIAPGKVNYDETNEDLLYCYVYAVKNNKVVMKLGIYEKIDEQKDLEMFDLTEFNEGSMILFEYFEMNPTKITELEIIESSRSLNTDFVNVFKMIKENVFIPSNPLYSVYSDLKTGKLKTTEIFNEIHKIYKELDKQKGVVSKEDLSNLKGILKELKSSFGEEKKFNNNTFDALATFSDNKYESKFMLCVLILEWFLESRIIVTDLEHNIYLDFPQRNHLGNKTVNQYIIIHGLQIEGLDVSTLKVDDIENTIETYTTDLPSIYKRFLGQDVEPDETEVLEETTEKSVSLDETPKSETITTEPITLDETPKGEPVTTEPVSLNSTPPGPLKISNPTQKRTIRIKTKAPE
jgi:hypothetical protein